MSVRGTPKARTRSRSNSRRDSAASSVKDASLKLTASTASLLSEASVSSEASIDESRDHLVPESITIAAEEQNRAAAAATRKVIEEVQQFRDEFAKVQSAFRSSLDREGSLIDQVWRFLGR